MSGGTQRCGWVIQNGLLAYAFFQGWGNTPDRFAAGQPGDALLTAAAGWSESDCEARRRSRHGGRWWERYRDLHRSGWTLSAVYERRAEVVLHHQGPEV